MQRISEWGIVKGKTQMTLTSRFGNLKTEGPLTGFGQESAERMAHIASCLDQGRVYNPLGKGAARTAQAPKAGTTF